VLDIVESHGGELMIGRRRGRRRGLASVARRVRSRAMMDGLMVAVIDDGEAVLERRKPKPSTGARWSSTKKNLAASIRALL
jgi:hypothetical protein